MRILVACDYYSPASAGGAERVAREVNTRLAAAGVRVNVVTAVEGEPFRDPGVVVETVPAWDLTPLLGAQFSVSPWYLSTRRLRTRLRRPDAVLAHSLHFHSSIAAQRLARHFDVPLVTVAHVSSMEHLHGLSRTLGELSERTVGRWLLRSSAEVIAVSDVVGRHCISRGAAPDTLTIASNGVDHARFTPSPEPVGEPVVLFVGRLIGNKGPDLLVQAAERLWATGHEFRLQFAGDGPMRVALEHRTNTYGPAVSFLGHCHDIASVMRNASVVVRPSYTEGLPLTVLEAMASRRCVVVSDIDANRAIVEHGVTGLLHRVGDPSSLASALSQALRAPELRSALAVAGHERSLDFTWDRTASIYADTLERVARARSAAVR